MPQLHTYGQFVTVHPGDVPSPHLYPDPGATYVTEIVAALDALRHRDDLLASFLDEQERALEDPALTDAAFRARTRAALQRLDPHTFSGPLPPPPPPGAGDRVPRPEPHDFPNELPDPAVSAAPPTRRVQVRVTLSWRPGDELVQLVVAGWDHERGEVVPLPAATPLDLSWTAANDLLRHVVTARDGAHGAPLHLTPTPTPTPTPEEP